MEALHKPSDQLSSISRLPLLKLTEQTILELGINPRYKKIIFGKYNVSGVGHPCGDLLSFSLFTHNGFITDLFHSGGSCCLTTALADILCHNLTGQPIEELITVSTTDIVDVAVPMNRMGCIRLPVELLRKLYVQCQTSNDTGIGK